MDAVAKLELFATQMHLEPAEEVGTKAIPLKVLPSQQEQTFTGRVAPCGQLLGEAKVVDGTGLPPKKNSLGVYHAAMPGGKQIKLLKTLLTSACERNCAYCPFRAGRNYRRATFKPEEMAQTFMEMVRAGLVEGLFLSSGIIKGGVVTQDKIIATAEILRRHYHYRGYLHLKIMPGAEKEQVLRTMQLANRVSVNLEAPNPERLQRLAPKKIFIDELFRPLQWIDEIRRSRPANESWNGRWPSSVTQFVVGAVGESDVELLDTSAYLYKRARLSRAYFSAFHPVPDTPLENEPAENPWREHRLYQASFLLRDYGFDMEELPFTAAGNLPLDADPKLAWAQSHLLADPVEVNRADREALLRVPGIGPKGVEAILAVRRRSRLRDLKELQATGVIATRAAPFVLLDGKRPSYQLRLFPTRP